MDLSKIKSPRNPNGAGLLALRRCGMQKRLPVSRAYLALCGFIVVWIACTWLWMLFR